MTNLSIQTKLLISFITSAVASAMLSFLQYYQGIVIENKTFIILIFSAFVCDVVLGIWKHLKAKDFSFKELFTKALTKIAISFLAMVLFNAMAGVEGIGETPVKQYLLMVGKILNLIYISGSAFNNMYFITEGKFPPIAWMGRMKEFNKTLDITKLKSPEEIQTEKTES